MKKLILTLMSLTAIGVAAYACDSLEVRRDGKQIVCYRFEKRLTLDDVKKRYERYKPDTVVLNVQDTVAESEAQSVVDLIQKEGIKDVRVAKPEKK
jgi:biopolymer transport protein ExbD